MVRSVAILAAAGSRKTEHVIDSALSLVGKRVLIVTYTNENQRQILRRIEQKVGVLPPHVAVMGWFSFLINQCARPYQRALTRRPFAIGGLNFKGSRNRFTRKSELSYFLDGNGDLYRDGVADFIVQLQRVSNGAVVSRLERVFTHIFVDEVQDLVGYDLDVLDLLLRSRLELLLVGDPRQHTFSTNTSPRNKRYQGVGLLDWFRERPDVCAIEERASSFRCCQAICDFADAIYPAMPRTVSEGVPSTEHDGVFQIEASEVQEYYTKFRPVVLRHDKNANTMGLPAMNIGLSKGSTFDRVLVFPTRPMRRYLEDRNPSALKAPERLYVAVTRARFSVAFVVDT